LEIQNDHRKFRGDRDIALAAVTSQGMSFIAFDENIKNDREVVMAAISQDPNVIKIVPKIFRDSDEIVRLARETKDKMRCGMLANG
jgi:hypothetical protein